MNKPKVRKRTVTSVAKRKKSNCRCPIVSPPSHAYTLQRAILCVSAPLLLSPTGAQTFGSPNQYPPFKNFSASTAAIIVILIAALFLMGFFSLYIRNCSDAAPEGSARRGSFGGSSWRRRGGAPRGLDEAVIETFPTFAYSTVKGLKVGKGALECTICLNEFEADETLRLIPKCYHVFHPDCLDAWLGSHVTCPVCRANLVPQPGETIQVPELNDSVETQNLPNEEVFIRVIEDPEQLIPLPLIDLNSSVDEHPLPPQMVDRNHSVIKNRPSISRSVRQKLLAKFSQSHSTGHSLVQPGENTDRFTLRLPEDVRKAVMSRALNRTTSCVALPGEASARRGYRRLDRVGNSDRWVFSMAPPLFSHATSVRSSKVMAADGEGSTSIESPSFKREDRMSEEAGPASTDSDRPLV